MWTYWRNSRWRRISTKYYRHAAWRTLGMWLAWKRTDIQISWCVCTHMDDDLQATGRPRKRWLDNITEDCEELNLTIHQASRLANDRLKWRNTVRNKGCRSAGTSSLSQGLKLRSTVAYLLVLLTVELECRVDAVELHVDSRYRVQLHGQPRDPIVVEHVGRHVARFIHKRRDADVGAASVAAASSSRNSGCGSGPAPQPPQPHRRTQLLIRLLTHVHRLRSPDELKPIWTVGVNYWMSRRLEETIHANQFIFHKRYDKIFRYFVPTSM